MFCLADCPCSVFVLVRHLILLFLLLLSLLLLLLSHENENENLCVPLARANALRRVSVIKTPASTSANGPQQLLAQASSLHPACIALSLLHLQCGWTVRLSLGSGARQVTIAFHFARLMKRHVIYDTAAT